MEYNCIGFWKNLGGFINGYVIKNAYSKHAFNNKMEIPHGEIAFIYKFDNVHCCNACEDFNQENNEDGKIFLYSPPHIRLGGNDIPDLRQIGRYVEAGIRHFAQQSQYLIPIEYDSEWKFITFRKVIDNQSNNHVLREITISKDVKAKLMKELNEMNINRYTMYLNEDALIKSLADEWALENA